MTIERWLPVFGHETDYQVSDQGRVRSLDRIIHRKIGKGETPNKLMSIAYLGKILRPGLASNGYFMVALNGKSCCVHVLVLTAFSGHSPDSMECCHRDGDKRNNNFENLRWGTRISNMMDKALHGTQLRGTDYASAKLTDASAKKIKELRGIHPQSELALMFNVSPSAIQAVHDGRTWKHV